MSKGKKDRAKSGQGAGQDAKWEQALLTTPFCEEGKWIGHITFLVGNQIEDYENINILASVVNSGTRKLFSIISEADLFEQVRELGNPKAKKGKETPLNYEVCEPCKLHLDNNESIPLPLLAKLIKFRLLDIKQRDIKRRETEKKGTSEKEKGKGGKADKKERGKSPKKGGGKKTPEPPSAKEGTKLKKRGEEDLDSKYIDDEPDDGPQHYVLVYGFNHPHLFSFLSDVGVNVDCVIRVSSEDYVRFEPVPETDALAEEPVKDEKTLALEEEAKREKIKKKKELKQFWKDLLPLLLKSPEGSKMHDIARLEYVVKNLLLPQNMEDHEEKMKMGADLFEDIACIIYDLLDAKRQYLNYLANLHLLHVPVFGQVMPPQPPESHSQPSMAAGGALKDASTVVTEAESKVPTEVDMRYYNELMDTVPHESVSVPLILNCMLEQVCATEEEKPPPSATPRPPRGDGLDHELASHIGGMAFKLSLTLEEQQMLSNEFAPPKKAQPPPKEPQLVSYHDDINKRLQHLKAYESFNPLHSELEMMDFEPVSNLCKMPQPSNATMKRRAARLQEVLHYCASGGLTQAEVDRVFKQFVFECMDLTSTDENGFHGDAVPKKPSTIPWDDPYPFFRGIPVLEDELESVSQEGSTEEPKSDETRSETESKMETKSPSPPPKDVTERQKEQADKLQKNLDEMRAKSSSPNRTRPRSGSRKSRQGSGKKRAKSPLPAEETPAEPTSKQAGSEDEGSRPPSRGILKSPSRSGSPQSRKSSVHSVHYEQDTEGNLILQPGDQPPEPDPVLPHRSVDEDMEELIQAQKRNLDEFCFAEHFEPGVLSQVLRSATYALPYMDTYYHRRDHSLLVVLHNPHSSQLSSIATWQTSLHSNVGFRNYLEHVAESIDEWTRTEEAKYEASRLAQEVEKIQKEADEAASRPSSAKDKKGRGRSKSPKKSPSRKSPGSRGSSTERQKSDNPYVRQGSLKAWKEEQDRIKAEEEAKEKEKAEKRARSASRRASKAAGQEDKDKKDKRPGSRGGSAKSRQSKENLEQPAEETQGQLQVEEPFWPFTGYDTGDNMIHASGIVSTLFPSDGSQVRAERVEFTQGTTSVKTSILKDGHLFMLHVLDPKTASHEEEEEEEELIERPEEAVEKADADKSDKEDNQESPKSPAPPQEAPKPKKPCVGRFGSFSAQLKDGICVSVSTYGDGGEPVDGKKYEPAEYVVPVLRSPSPTAKESPGKGRKSTVKDRGAPTPVDEPQEEDGPVEEKPEEPAIEQQFQEIHLTSPDGLLVHYSLESKIGIKPVSEEDRKPLVRQCYPFRTAGYQACEAARKAAMMETSRVIDRDGTVVKTMRDGTVQILHADGAVVQSLEQPQEAGSRQSSPRRAGSAKSGSESPTRKGRISRRQSAQKEVQEQPVEQEPPAKGLWVTTLPSGDKVVTKHDGSTEQEGKCLVCVASDPQTRQVMATRDDHVIMIGYPDGSTVVEHADKTRITVCYKQVQVIPEAGTDAAETGEAPQMTTKEVKFVQVECPGFATVKFDQSDNHCSTEFGNGTIVNTYMDGSYDIFPHSGGHLALEADGSSKYYPQPNNSIDFADPNQELVYSMKHFSDTVFESTDNEGNYFSVMNTGMASVVLASGSEAHAEESCEDEDTGKEKFIQQKVVTYKQHAPRFFIVNSDGSGTELLRYQDIADYMIEAEDDPATAVLMDSLPDFPGVRGITVLRPQLRGVSDMWLKKYDMDNIIPPGLTSRDLRSLPSKEVKKEGAAFGTTVGQGLAVGSAVKPPLRAPVLQCPTILELRQLIQYKPVSAELREQVTGGLRQYAEYVKERSDETEYLLMKDPRSEEEKIHASDLLAVILATDEASKKNIGENIKAKYEQATAPPMPSPPPTPQPKRTQADWERDKRELAEEAEGRKALRQHDVPPYFESEFGKAFLLSQAPDMESLAKELAEDPRRDESRAIRSASASTTASERGQSASVPLPEIIAAPDSGISDRSISTTPAMANAGATIQGSPCLAQGATLSTPSKQRPINPTPMHATGAAASKPVALQQAGQPVREGTYVTETPASHAYPSIQEKPQEELVEENEPQCETQHRSKLMDTDVIGLPRIEPVRVPAFLKGGRPNASQNERFAMVEDPVRRKVFTSSVAGATIKGQQTISMMRGFELLPDFVNFGVLKEGCTYRFKVLLKNMGVDSCRFRIRQPPPSTGIRVLYQPGPVAAGMKAELLLEIYAIAVGVQGETGVGSISHNLQIITETHTLFLPVTATVLTADEFEIRCPTGAQGIMAPGVSLVTSKPPGGQVLTRPRRDVEGQSLQVN